jgi:hypothetical protein
MDFEKQALFKTTHARRYVLERNILMELTSLFDAFYNKLVLRDSFGKIVPGFILIISVIIASDVGAVNAIVSKMNLMSWILAAELGWLIGFALQYIGELGWALMRHPQLNIPDLYPEDMDRNTARRKFHEKWAKFQRVATPNDRIHAERLNVIREACGNASISLGLSCGVLAVSFWSAIRTRPFPTT